MKHNALLLSTFQPSIHPFAGPVEAALREALGDIFELGDAVESEAIARFTPQSLRGYDCLIAYNAPFRFLQEDRDTMAMLIEYLMRGGALFVIHYISSGETSETAQIVGGKFKMHPAYNRYRVVPAQCAHPILAGIEPFEIEDEMHQVFTSPLPDRTLLLQCINDDGRKIEQSPVYERDIFAKSSGGLVDFAWCHQYGEGRVVYSAPGHGKATMSNPMYLKFLRNCARWLARDGQ